MAGWPVWSAALAKRGLLGQVAALAQTRFAALDEQRASVWQDWLSRWLAWQQQPVLAEQQTLLTSLDRQLTRLWQQTLEANTGSHWLGEVPWWPHLQLTPELVLQAHAPVAHGAENWQLQQAVVTQQTEQTWVSLQLAARGLTTPVAPLGQQVQHWLADSSLSTLALWQSVSVQRKLAHWLQTPPYPVLVWPRLADLLAPALAAVWAPVLAQTVQTQPELAAALGRGYQLLQDLLGAMQATEQAAGTQRRSAALQRFGQTSAQWLVSLQGLPADLATAVVTVPAQQQQWQQLGVAAGPAAMVRSGLLPAELAAAVRDVAAALPTAPAAVVVRGDATQLLPVLSDLLADHGLTLPPLAGCYWDPPYNTQSTAFGYADRRDTDLWQAEMAAVAAGLWPWLDPQATVATSMAQAHQPALVAALQATWGSDALLTAIQVQARHAGRLLKADKLVHETLEALTFWRRSALATLHQPTVQAGIDEHMWQLQPVGPPQEVLQLAGKTVQLWPPDAMVVQRLPASPVLSKRILIRGALREANSSGRFYTAALEPLREQRPGWYAYVPRMGDDGLAGRWFCWPTKSTLRNGAYFQGYVGKPRHEPIADLWDFTAAYNQVAQEGGVQYRNGKKPVALLHKVLQLQGVAQRPNGWWLDPMAGSGSLGHALFELRQQTAGQQTALLLERGEAASAVLLPRLERLWSLSGTDHGPLRALFLAVPSA